jgi:choline dehydrogenase
MKKKTFLIAFLTLVVSLTAGVKEVQYDYIIIGCGTAGSVLARKLTDDFKTKVLVLEAGVNQNSDPVVLTASGPNLINDWTLLTYDPYYSFTYTSLAVNPLSSLGLSAGRGWGGSSKHNYLQAVRGTPDIYNTWATASGNQAWSYNNMLPLMLALENYTTNGVAPFDPAQRGVGGPISITQTASITSDPLGIQMAAVTNAGFINDINDPTNVSSTGIPQLGFSSYQGWATPGPTLGTLGTRSFSSNMFLPTTIVTVDGKAVDGRLLRIESNAFVSRVLFDGNRAKGVEFIYGDKSNKILKAYGKKIILCAGAIESPAILQRSGIGDPALLGPLGIDVVVNNPNVGANLKNQYGVTAIVSGITTNALPGLQGFVNGYCTTPLAANFQYPNPTGDATRRLQFDAFATPGGAQIVGFILEPSSTGNIQIVNKNPLTPPNINLNMYTDGSFAVNGTDGNLSIAAYNIIYRAVLAGGGTMVFPPAAWFADTSGATLYYDAVTSTSGLTPEDHFSATTIMSSSMATGVVDGNLNVYGTENLMVVDLGVVPKMPNGNTCYCVYMVALRACTILGLPVPPGL